MTEHIKLLERAYKLAEKAPFYDKRTDVFVGAGDLGARIEAYLRKEADFPYHTQRHNPVYGCEICAAREALRNLGLERAGRAPQTYLICGYCHEPLGPIPAGAVAAYTDGSRCYRRQPLGDTIAITHHEPPEPPMDACSECHTTFPSGMGWLNFENGKLKCEGCANPMDWDKAEQVLRDAWWQGDRRAEQPHRDWFNGIETRELYDKILELEKQQ